MADTPHDTIRRAATLMRDRAMAATPGPWRVGTHVGRTLYARSVPGVAKSGHLMGVMDAWADAVHAAALHPAVMLRLADAWFALADEMADYPAVRVPLGIGIESRPGEPSNLWTHTYNAAVEYLGEADGEAS